MSLRYVGRVAFQAGMRTAQVMKESVPKTLKDSSAAACESQQQARKFSAGGGAIREAAAARNGKLKQSEESLRTVLFLSCWGPNS